MVATAETAARVTVVKAIQATETLAMETLSPPSQEGSNVWYVPTGNQKDQKNGDGSSQQSQSYDNGQWHGPEAYSKPKVHGHGHGGSHRGSTSWDGKGWRVGSRRSMAKRYLA
uniref:WGS project CBMI000000000 data, contig CS3069_c003866 n=1 Tax=Fusarium clavum TaxID=2594811 RepID=A0A090ME25_9HYPO|nr:unnamed protein product [Fusarium clavum]